MRRLTIILALIVTTATSCGSGSSSEDTKSIDLGRVVVLAEEFLLADVLSLGIEPVASSATVPAAGFQGLQEFETAEIEVLSMTGLSLENLTAMSTRRRSRP